MPAVLFGRTLSALTSVCPCKASVPDSPAIKNDDFKKQPFIVECLEHAKKNGGRLHLMGLLSDGGVHSHIKHLLALLRAAKEAGVEHVYIHAFGDGRDTAPKSATIYVQQLLDATKEIGVGELVTFVGRYYAMDRDKRWDRVKIAVDALVKGEGEKSDDPVKAIEKSYENGVTDEFVKPLIFGDDASRIKGSCWKVLADIRERHYLHLQLPLRPYARAGLSPRL